MDELELEGAGQALLKGEGSHEARRAHLVGAELGGGAELLHADGAYGQLPAGDPGEGVEAIAAEHAEPVREVHGGDMLAEHLADQRYQVVHVRVGLVDVVEDVVAVTLFHTPRSHPSIPHKQRCIQDHDKSGTLPY